MLAARAHAGPRDADPDDPTGAHVDRWGTAGDDAGVVDREDDDIADASSAPTRSLRNTYALLGDTALQRVVTRAPPIATVVVAAYRAAGIAADPTHSWSARSRLSALIPWLSVRAGQNEAWRDVLDPTVSHSLVFDVRAAWRLDRLLFDPNELRIAATDVARRRERRRLATHVIHVYFDWVAARAAAEHDVRAVLDAEEKAAELDALTAGWFSDALANRAESH